MRCSWSQARPRENRSAAERSSLSASPSRNWSSSYCGRGIEGSAGRGSHGCTQLMFGNGLAPLGVGVDHVGGESQLQGGEAQDLAVDFQWSLPGEAPEDTDEGNLIGEAQPVVRPVVAGQSRSSRLRENCHLGSDGAGRCRASVAGMTCHDEIERLDQSIHKAKHNQFLILTSVRYNARKRFPWTLP